MFWQFENGTLLNLNILDSIYFSHHNGLFHVMGSRRDDRPITLFTSKDEEHVERVLLNITRQLESDGSLIRETNVRSR